MAAGRRGSTVDWESIARGMIDGVTEFEIPAGLTLAPDIESMFRERKGLTSVVIQEGVTSIGRAAFQNCTSLANVILPSTLTEIKSYAFYYCPLTSITIPEGVTVIEGYAFVKPLFTRLVIPSTVVTTYNYFITQATNLDELVMLPTTPPTLNGVNVNTWGKATWKLYVPDASLNDYKTAQNWSSFASRTYPISDLPA